MKKTNGSWCYNCGHSMMSHAYYNSLNGHVVIEFEPIILRSVWFGFEVVHEIKSPVLKEICRCKRFISKHEYLRDEQRDRLLDGQKTDMPFM